MLAAILFFDFRNSEVVKEGLNENLVALKGVVALHQVQSLKDAAAACPKLAKQSCSSEFSFFLVEEKRPLVFGGKVRLKQNEGMKRLKAKKEKKRDRSERKKGRKKERS